MKWSALMVAVLAGYVVAAAAATAAYLEGDGAAEPVQTPAPPIVRPVPPPEPSCPFSTLLCVFSLASR